MGKDKDSSSRKAALCTGLATTGTERPARSSILTNRDWAWMAVSKGARQCTGQTL